MFEARDFLLLEAAADPEILEVLRDELDTLSLAYAGRDRAGRLAPSRFPGYLEVAQEGWHVFVPWTLAAMFPAEAALGALLRIGGTVAVEPGETICLSGSSVWTGHDIAFSDVDCCQYLPAAPAIIAERATSFHVSTDQRVLVGAQYGDETATHAVPPWPDGWADLAARMATATEAAQAERLMLEFLVFCDVYDLLPVSNVVLAMVVGERELGAAKRSFVFQEAIAIRAGANAPTWTLVDPAQLVGYLQFLRTQTRHYAEKNPIKAVKRALSLASTLRLSDFVDRALDLLTSAEAAASVVQKRQAELEAWIARSGEDGRNLLRRSQYNDVGTHRPVFEGETEAVATRIAMDLLAHLDMLDGGRAASEVSRGGSGH